MTRQTTLHNFNVPETGDADYADTFAQYFDSVDNAIEIRDTENNISNYEPQEGAKFTATDSGVIYIGDGSSWTQITSTGINPNFGNVTADSVSTDDLGIGSRDFVSDGDFVGIGPSIDGFERSFSTTTSQTYTSDPSTHILRTIWDFWRPADAQGAVRVIAKASGTNTTPLKFRLHNLTDDEVIVGPRLAGSGTVLTFSEQYTPTTTGLDIDIRPEILSDDGSSVRVEDINIQFGIQL